MQAHFITGALTSEVASYLSFFSTEIAHKMKIIKREEEFDLLFLSSSPSLCLFVQEFRQRRETKLSTFNIMIRNCHFVSRNYRLVESLT